MRQIRPIAEQRDEGSGLPLYDSMKSHGIKGVRKNSILAFGSG
jgi:hypothetical protein